MQSNPLFSVIMPNYNNGKYIKEAIESVLIQTYANWELIIVDDASTDDSVDIIQTYLQNRKIKLIKSNTNRGVAYAAKLAVDNSSGSLIGTLDSDDVLEKTALEVMVNEYMDNPDHGLIYSNYYKCDKNLTILGKLNLLDPLPGDISLQELLLSKESTTPVSWHFRTFRKSAYDRTEGYDPSLLCYEDRDLYYKLEKVTAIKFINKCLLYYRDTSEQGAYRGNPKSQYYWFICEYKETGRRLGIKLPYINKDRIPLFWCNVMYLYLRKSSNIPKKILRNKLQHFFLDIGYNYLNNNRFLAITCILNSFMFGVTHITLHSFKKLYQ